MLNQRNGIVVKERSLPAPTNSGRRGAPFSASKTTKEDPTKSTYLDSSLWSSGDAGSDSGCKKKTDGCPLQYCPRAAYGLGEARDGLVSKWGNASHELYNAQNISQHREGTFGVRISRCLSKTLPCPIKRIWADDDQPIEVFRTFTNDDTVYLQLRPKQLAAPLFSLSMFSAYLCHQNFH